MRIVAKTDIGLQRSENQDNYRAGEQPDGTVWALVCDGMGGAQGGLLAATLACDHLEQAFTQNIDTLKTPAAVRKFLFENPDKFDAREWLKPAREAAKQVCKQRYLEFGCEGQGSKIKGLSLQAVAAQYASGALAQVVN